jgi:hypothetical protein
MQPVYPSPIVIVNTTGTGLQPAILDIGAFMNPFYPPVIGISMSAAATVVVYGALEVTGTTTPTLVNPINVSGGGFTTSDFYDLIPGIRFYQVNVTANAGTVVVKCGVGPMTENFSGLPQLLRISNVATAGM